MTHIQESVWQAERRRKIQILRRIVYVGLVTQSLATLLPVLAGSTTSLLSNLALLVVVILGWVLLRYDQLELATHLMFGAIIAYSMLYGVEQNDLFRSSQNLVIPIVGSILLLRPRWSFIYAGIGMLAFMLTYLLALPPTEAVGVTLLIGFIRLGFFFIIIAMFCYFATRGYDRQTQTALERTVELETIKSQLEERVAERTHAAEQALADLQQSSVIIRQMSVPVLPVAEGVLVLPLIGAIDTQRAALLTETLLKSVYAARPKIVLIDITGLSGVDRFVAGVLLETTRAVRLLGAEPVLVGIQPAMADTLVSLGLDLSSLITTRDVRSGLAYALKVTAQAEL
jgi:anti-anti-sigma factor